MAHLSTNRLESNAIYQIPVIQVILACQSISFKQLHFEWNFCQRQNKHIILFYLNNLNIYFLSIIF